MQEALKNPYYKKIWEKVIMNRHPEAKNLEEALEMELLKLNCIISRYSMGMWGHLSTNFFYEIVSYTKGYNDLFLVNRGFQNYNEAWVNTSINWLQVELRILLEEIDPNTTFAKNEGIRTKIYGRQITLEDILEFLIAQELTKGASDVESRCITSMIEGVIKIDITGYADTGHEPQHLYLGNFFWKLSKPLHEQTPETWEKIANLI